MPKRGVSVYQPLADYLATRPAVVVQVDLTLDEIAAIIGVPLPLSAREGTYWSNGRPDSHVRAIRRAGWRVARPPSQLVGPRVRFERVLA